MKSFSLSALALGCLSLISPGPIHAQDGEQVAETNMMCPVLTDEPIDPKISVEYRSKTVYFCCNKCRRKFVANPDQYLAALPQFGDVKVQDEHTNNHDHAHDHGQTDGLSRLIAFLGKFHPIVVHFPIALILMAGLLELISAVKRKGPWEKVAKINLSVGAIAAVVAAPLGWAAAANAKYPGLEDTLFRHRWLGASLACLAVVTAGVGWLAQRRATSRLAWGYRVLLALACLLVIATGHYGATLVFGPDPLSW